MPSSSPSPSLPPGPPPKNKPAGGRNYDGLFFYVLLGFWLSVAFANWANPAREETIPYSSFISFVQAGKIEKVAIQADQIVGTFKVADAKYSRFRTLRVEDPQLASRLAGRQVTFEGVADDSFFRNLLLWIVGPIFLFTVLSFLLSRFAGKDGFGSGLGPGFGLASIEKSRAKIYLESNVKTTFADVAGVDEAKAELQEVIGFLKEPARYNRLGGHLPKGILLVGPPGTGKTLLARAIAGEAGVPFFSISGSEFVEMFVGVGAARVRDLFTDAQKNAPCIIFIDELDALGRARGISPMSGGHDEKEQTLNQLLVEMDGFDPRQGIILLAATNRPEVLDQALLRAGRFDRHVLVDRPDKLGRQQILQVHLGKVKCAATLQVDEIAALTPGFTGADLANLVNEAALRATRNGADELSLEDFVAALERIVGGLEKKNRLLNAVERRSVAFHEMGHTLVSLSIPGSDPVQKVSIIPRGIGALGYTMQRPIEDRFLMTRTELESKLTILLGGRAAELLVFAETSTGASDDLAKATDIARSMATRYGMVKDLGPVAYEGDHRQYLDNQQPASLEGRFFSEETAREIDCAVRDLIACALERALAILKAQRAKLEQGAELLLARETLTQDDLLALMQEDFSAAEAPAQQPKKLASFLT
ncbi:MAG: ATP-dependent zinc metalloprotease FtsH [Cyanobacteria bacterium REEB67]|nr:ATP-dependent zinc metalloprotease FtsH [Cyanobacteria bacterium REEB67]